VKKGLTLIAIGLIVVGVIAMSSAFGHGSFHGLNFAFGVERGSGKLETETRSVESFSRIESNIGADIIVHVGAPQKVTLTIDDNLLDNITTKVHGQTLEISSRKSFSVERDCRLEIWIPTLEGFSSNGSGDVEVHDLKGGDFSYELSGSGNFTAYGSVDRLDVQLNGSGNVDTRKLTAEDVEVSINGSGDAVVSAKGSLNIEINGSGNVSYFGNPEQIHQDVSGSGSIEKLKSI
jgi:hypothetical protein